MDFGNLFLIFVCVGVVICLIKAAVNYLITEGHKIKY